jgi:peptidyl-prolyl cis-trans isomerase-like 4
VTPKASTIWSECG